MNSISLTEFQCLDLRIGRVLEAEKVPESRSLIKMKVDLGEPELRQVLAGIAEWYQPEDLVNQSFIFVTNLEPKKMMGEESQGMILCADIKSKAVLIPAPEVPPGTIVR
ncbi:MAG: methionine--tRNA ligase [Candidatus Marinimicrobia bacterium]|nr:methionine--tRNA ligase [Candidatus Neomarinimicrobiota bacterium]